MRTLLVGAVMIPILLACGGMGGSGSESVSAPASATPKLEFTKWKIEWIGGGIENEFDFLPGGTFVDQSHPSNVNTYAIDGSKVHMEYNSSFVIYDGEFVDEFTMGGTYTTQAGLAGPWKGIRIYD